MRPLDARRPPSYDRDGMNRYGTRDASLTARIGLALAGMALIYLGGFAVVVAVLVEGVAERSWSAVLVGLVGLVAIPFLLYVQYHDAGRATVRALRAKPEPLGDPFEPMLARLAAQADVDPPELLIAHSWSPNALAALRPGDRPAVIVTTELLRRLEPPEVEAVIAHEIGHLANGDGAVMTVVGGPALMCASMWHADDRRWRVFAILFSPLWLVALLLMLVVARSREYTADRSAALVTGRPEQLMSALAKLGRLEPRGDLRGGTAVRAFCIVGRHESRLGLLRDHPPVEKRLAALGRIARELGRPVPRY